MTHETICNAIYVYPRGELRRQLIACLRQPYKTHAALAWHGPASCDSWHAQHPCACTRGRGPHARVLGRRSQGSRPAVAVLVERLSRAVLLAKIPDASAASVLAAFTGKTQSVVEPLRQTLTYDQGREMAHHAELTAATHVRVYFCDPRSPWQRGTCENIHGLLRMFLPKGTDLSVHTQEQLDEIADKLNHRPRQTLNWHTPLQMLAAILSNPTDRSMIQ